MLGRNGRGAACAHEAERADGDRYMYVHAKLQYDAVMDDCRGKFSNKTSEGNGIDRFLFPLMVSIGSPACDYENGKEM